MWQSIYFFLMCFFFFRNECGTQKKKNQIIFTHVFQKKIIIFTHVFQFSLSLVNDVQPSTSFLVEVEQPGRVFSPHVIDFRIGITDERGRRNI